MVDENRLHNVENSINNTKNVALNFRKEKHTIKNKM
jgi:hypothetical protein